MFDAELSFKLHRVTWWTREDVEEPELTDNESDDDDIDPHISTEKPKREHWSF